MGSLTRLGDGARVGRAGFSLRLVLVGTAALVAGLVVAAFAGASHVEPVLLPGPSNGDKTCAANEGDGQEWVEFKPQPEPPPSGSYSDGTLDVTITYDQTGNAFSWSSNIGVDAVIVKGGSEGTYLYRYDPPAEATSDDGLTVPQDESSPGGNGISHISFCYDEEPNGTLIVVKDVVNDDDGEASAGDWTMNVSGPTALSFPGAEAPGTSNEVEPGDYDVTESGGPAGYTLSYEGDCDAQGNVSVASGETKTCILVNDDVPAEQGLVIVRKVMNGGTDTFTFSGTPAGSISVDGGTISAVVAPGTYTSTEAAKEGWDLHGIVCDDANSSGSVATRTATFRVEAGETVTCQFRNKKRPTVIVKKVMIGGTDTFSFTGTPSGSISENGGTISQQLDDGGTFTSTEAPKAGWALTAISCDDSNSTGDVETRTATFVATAGEVVTCTFTNTKLPTPEPGTIVVQKVTVPAGSTQEFDFLFEEDEFTLTDGGEEVFDGLDAGVYSVSEDVPEGWTLTSAVCSDGSDPDEIVLAAGETVTCIFTNTEDEPETGTIIVEKQTSPDGSAGSFGFSGDAAGTIGDGGQIVVSGLEPGTYTSTEAGAEGWLLTAIDCDDADSTGSTGTRTATFQLAAGETVTCTFTNTRPTVGKGSIDVQKSVTPTQLKEPGGPVTYTVRILNTSADAGVTITSVVDDRFGSLENVAGGNPAGCFDLPINLAPGESSTCQFPKTITGPGGSSHVNVVTASGSDEHGNPVSDSDDARVDIVERLIDLVVVKDATSPTPLNGIVTYDLTVTNKGPDTATNVQLADPAPAGITYLTAVPSQGTCTLTPALVTCSLGTLAAGQSATVRITARATAVGTHTNTATVTGEGGREQNPADNVDDAVTVVPAPVTPPVTPPSPPAQPDVCLTLTVTPKMITADGRPDRLRVLVRAGSRRMRGVKVLAYGSGVRKTARSNAQGVASLRINPRRAGLVTITAIETNRKVCGARRVGVVGVFLPPLTG